MGHLQTLPKRKWSEKSNKINHCGVLFFLKKTVGSIITSSSLSSDRHCNSKVWIGNQLGIWIQNKQWMVPQLAFGSNRIRKINSRHPNCRLVCFLCNTSSASVEGHLNNLLWQKRSSTRNKIAQPDVTFFSTSTYP